MNNIRKLIHVDLYFYFYKIISNYYCNKHSSMPFQKKYLLFISLCLLCIHVHSQQQQIKKGNPIIPGWYADPDAAIFKNKCWIYPTYSAPFEQQVFLDAFSSTDLQTWT